MIRRVSIIKEGTPESNKLLLVQNNPRFNIILEIVDVIEEIIG